MLIYLGKKEFMDFISKLLNQQLPAIIVIFSFIAAFMIDFLFSVVFKKFASKTKTNFDDNLIKILHKPIYQNYLEKPLQKIFSSSRIN